MNKTGKTAKDQFQDGVLPGSVIPAVSQRASFISFTKTAKRPASLVCKSIRKALFILWRLYPTCRATGVLRNRKSGL